jgi:hypothetical protein
MRLICRSSSDEQVDEGGKTAMTRWAVLILSFMCFAGCASVPHVTYTYYPAAWNAVVSVTQTVGCNADKTRLVVVDTPTVTPAYFSDFTRAYRIKHKDLEGFFADSDMTMTFFDDGRLKGVNQTSTGQGEAIVKAVVAVGATVLSITAAEKGPARTLDECNTIEAWGGGKPVTLTYRTIVDDKAPRSVVDLDASPESKALHALLQNRLPRLKAEVGSVADSISGPGYDTGASGASSGVVLLELQKTGSVTITVKADGESIGGSRFVVPRSDTYKLPIPKAAMFGKQSFALTLAESGAVTSVGYGKTAGTAGVFSALGSIASAETPAAKAAELKSEADLIAQQQRLVLCQTKPDQCK